MYRRRIISCLSVFVITLSLVVVPVYATVGDGVGYITDQFWSMVRRDWDGVDVAPVAIVNVLKEFLKSSVTPETATDQDWKDAYNVYVTNIQNNVGTATVIDGGVRLYFVPTAINVNNGGILSSHSLGSVFTAVFSSLASTQCYSVFPFVKLPFDCTYSYGYSFNGDNCYVSANFPSDVSGTAGKNTYINGFTVTATDKSKISSFYGSVWIDCKPYTGVVGDYYNVDISNNSRVGSITGDFGIIGDNNQIIKSDKNYIVNDTTNNYYNPATGLEKPIVNWSYDYGDRSYTLQLEGNVTSKVVFGDENVTIKEGDTIYNIYYITEKPVDPSPSPSPHVHNYTPAVTKEPTCLAPGVRTYTCSACGSTYTETIPAAGHKWNPHKTVNTEYNEDGTVKQEGYTIWKCSVCGEEYKTSNTTGPPSGGGGSDGGGGGGIFKDIFGIFVDFIGFFSGLFKDFVAGGIKEFIKALTDPVSDIFGILNPFNWFD